MANLQNLLVIQLLCGSFTLCLLEITVTETRSVHPGENITLSCNISHYSEISWYRLRSEEVKLLISAEEAKLQKTFSLFYSMNESHFDMTVSSSSVSLVIIGVTETDLGFYYCGGRNNRTHVQFGKPISLNFTDDQNNETDNLSKPPQNHPSKGAEFWMTVSVCLVSILLNLTLMCMFCFRCKGKSVSSGSSCSNTGDTAEKEENIHYSSIQHKRRSEAAAKKNTASESDNVTYATVTTQARRP